MNGWRPKPARPDRIDYKALGPQAIPKCERPAKTRARRNRAMRADAADDRARVFARQGHVCFAVHVSPVCKRRVRDPHELIPVSEGGPRVSWNRVGVCRQCHHATDATIGGRRLMFNWPGKADGQPPNADVPGNVTCYWRGGGGGGKDRAV